MYFLTIENNGFFIHLDICLRSNRFPCPTVCNLLFWFKQVVSMLLVHFKIVITLQSNYFNLRFIFTKIVAYFVGFGRCDSSQSLQFSSKLRFSLLCLQQFERSKLKFSYYFSKIPSLSNFKFLTAYCFCEIPKIMGYINSPRMRKSSY